MSKLFNVVDDLHLMNSDQMKGAIRNMENIGNLLHASFRSVIETTEDDNSVLGMNEERFDSEITEMYLPGVDGGTVIVKSNRLDMLVLWQLEFFAKWGNLNLNWTSGAADNAIHYDVEDCAASGGYMEARAEKFRSSAAIYDSMSKATKF